MPITTALRLHLLSCTCPLTRIRGVVDVLRLLNFASSIGSAQFVARPSPTREFARAQSVSALGGGELQVVWDTAEAGGCELLPPRPVVDWAPHDHGES